MGRIDFESSFADGIYTYRHVATSPIVRSRSAGIEGNRFGGWEEAAAYVGVVWRLTAGQTMFVVPRFHRDDALTAVGAPFALVRWEHDATVGFVPARSSVRLHPPPSPWEREHEDEAALYELHDVASLGAILAAISGDASAELNVYALASHARGQEVVAPLRADEAPKVRDLLKAGEILIDLVVGCDLDYDSALTVQSRSDIGTAVVAIADSTEALIRTFEQGPEIATPDELEVSIRTLMQDDG